MSTRFTTPDQLLAFARAMLDSPTPSTVSAWSRAAALLTRQAIEQALTDYWRERLPGLERMNMRAQLNAADVIISRHIAGELRYVWHALSNATHHRPYELDPTREELDSLIMSAERAIRALRVRGAAPRTTAAASDEHDSPVRSRGASAT